MANLDHPHGLRAVRCLGSTARPPLTKYLNNSTTAVYPGDVLVYKTTGVVGLCVTTAGTTVGNHIIGVAATPAAAGEYVWVYDSPDTVFEVQSDGTTDPGETTARSKIGLAAPLVLTAASGGVSQHELDYSGLTTDTKHPLKVIGLSKDPREDASLSHADFEVIFNRHFHLAKASPRSLK